MTMGYYRRSLRSFDNYAKQSGLAPLLELTDQEVDRTEAFIRSLRGRPWWYDNKQEHFDIVKSHGGTIWGQNNEDGIGATFGFTLPSISEEERAKTKLARVGKR